MSRLPQTVEAQARADDEARRRTGARPSTVVNLSEADASDEEPHIAHPAGAAASHAPPQASQEDDAQPSAVDRCMGRAHFLIAKRLGGYGKFASRHPRILLSLGVFALSLMLLGLLTHDNDNDFACVMRKEDTRLEHEEDQYAAHFGGDPRLQTITLRASGGGTAASLRGLQALLYVLTPLTKESEGGASSALTNPDQVRMRSFIGRDEDAEPEDYTQQSFCERPEVPAVLSSSSSAVVTQYVNFTACMLDGSGEEPLSSTWAIDRFPCTRTSALDCFREGEYDYPSNLRELDRVQPEIRAATTVARDACLDEAVSGVAAGSARTEARDLLDWYATQFASWGYGWRKSILELATDDRLHDHIRDSMELTQRSGGATVEDCIANELCCLTWRGETIHPSEIFSEDLIRSETIGNGKDITAMRTTLTNYHYSHPRWVLNSGISGVLNRKRLTEEWEQVIIDYLTPMHDGTRDSGFASDERYGAYHVDFFTARSMQDSYQEASRPEGGAVALAFVLVLLFALMAFSRFSFPYQMAFLIYSRTALAFWGVLSVALSTIAAFGLGASFGIDLTGTTANLVPFLSLAMGMHDVYILTHATCSCDRSNTVTSRIKAAMMKSAPAILMRVIGGTFIFAMASLVPVRAVSLVAKQLSVTVVVNFITLMTLFLSALVYDMRRTARKQTDCFSMPLITLRQERVRSERAYKDHGAYLRKISERYLGKCVMNRGLRYAVLALLFAFTVAFAVVGTSLVETGLERSDLTNHGSYQRSFLQQDESHFGGAEAWLMTSSELAHHTDAAGTLFTGSLAALAAVDGVVAHPSPQELSWYSNPTTGFVAFADGTPITSANFKTLFSSWARGAGAFYAPDLFCASSISAGFVPCESFDAARDSLVATRSRYFLHDLTDFDAYTESIERVRSALDDVSGNAEVSSARLVFAYGDYFAYWEQFIDMEDYVYGMIMLSFIIIAAVVLVLEFNVRASLCVIITCLCISFEVYGFAPLLSIKHNAFSVLNIAITAVFAFSYTVHTSNVYLTSPEKTSFDRAFDTVDEITPAYINGAASTILAMVPLAMSRYPFFRNYYAGLFAIIAIVSALYGAILLPLLLSLCNVKAYYIPKRPEEVDLIPDAQVDRNDTGISQSAYDGASGSESEGDAHVTVEMT